MCQQKCRGGVYVRVETTYGFSEGCSVLNKEDYPQSEILTTRLSSPCKGPMMAVDTDLRDLVLYNAEIRFFGF